MVPKGDICEKLKEQKKALQESLSLTFIEHNGVAAAYTNVRNTVEWLLSKKTLQETIMMRSHGCSKVTFFYWRNSDKSQISGDLQPVKLHC